MPQLTAAQKIAFQGICNGVVHLTEGMQLSAFDQLVPLVDAAHADQIRALTKDQKLAIIKKGATDPQGAADDLAIDVFDATILKDHPEMADALANVTREKKLALMNEQEPQRTRDVMLALFDAKVIATVNPKTPQERADLEEKLKLLTDDQKLQIIADAQKDPAHAAEIAARETKLAIFDAAILKDHPEMKDALAKISADDKLKLMDEQEPQRTEDIKIKMFDISMADMYKQHPELKDKIDKIPRQQKLQLIDAIGEGLKQDPQLLDHVNQAMKDHPQAFNSAIDALIHDPSKKGQLVGLLAADQMQHKIVDMFGGPNSAMGKFVNWICNFLIDGPLGGFITSIFSMFAGGMSGLQASGNNSTLKGASADFEIAHTAIHGSVEDTNSGKIYHLQGELNDDEKAELNREPTIKYNYDRAANETTIRSSNRNWSLPMPAHA